MFINGYGNCVYLSNDAITSYKNNVHSTINRTPVDSSNNLDKVKYIITLVNLAKTNQNLVITLGKLTNVTFSLKDTHLIGR